MQPVSFKKLAELEQFVAENHISMDGWTKRLEDLFQETQTNDCSIWIESAQKIERRVRPAFIKVVAQGLDGKKWILKEESQRFYDKEGNFKSERKRGNLFVGEKLSATEDPIQGALRGIKEELNIDAKREDLTLDKEESSERPSDSYPTLKSIYHIFRLTYSCPTEIYETHQDGFTEEEIKHDGFKQKTRFVWIQDN